MRHRWSPPNRMERKTERTCRRPGCGLIKVTRHEPGDPGEKGIRDEHGNLVWTEWWRVAGSDGMPERLTVADGRTPECRGTETAKEAA